MSLKKFIKSETFFSQKSKKFGNYITYFDLNGLHLISMQPTSKKELPIPARGKKLKKNKCSDSQHSDFQPGCHQATETLCAVISKAP
jgi:hypothetical protein